MEFITLLVQAIGSAITGFVSYVPEALVGAFDGLFISGAGETLALTNLAGGLLALAGISMVIGCVVKVYHIFSGRVRKSI